MKYEVFTFWWTNMGTSNDQNELRRRPLGGLVRRQKLLAQGQAAACAEWASAKPVADISCVVHVYVHIYKYEYKCIYVCSMCVYIV